MKRNDTSSQFDSPVSVHRRPRFYGLMFVVGLAVAVEFSQPIQTVFAQASSETSLPLPAHPGRTIAPPEATRPKTPASLTKQKKAFPTRTSDRPPIPGHPARNLAPPGPSPEEAMEEPEEEEEEEEEPPPGLLLKLPHEFREGGITVEYIYTGESFNNTRGGMNTNRATNYRSNFDLVFQIDSQKMGWWEGGRFFIYGQNLQGKPLSASHVGDFQLFSNIDSTITDTERPYFTTVSEYWYEHLMWDQQLRFKIGKQDANADFALTDLGGDFVHSSFGLPPMIPLPTFPSQALGLATFLKLTEQLTAAVGVYDGTFPSGPTGGRFGFDTLGDNGAISLYQLEYKGQRGPNGQHPVTLRVGGWYHSGNWEELVAVAPRTFNQNYGFWTTFDRMIWKESYGDDDEQGLGVFGQFGWAPDNRNLFREYYGAGLVYKGLIPGRDEDLTGVAVANALVSNSQQTLDGLPFNNETVLELFHKILFSPYFSLQPDVQYIRHPGAQYRDSIVAGLRFELVL